MNDAAVESRATWVRKGETMMMMMMTIMVMMVMRVWLLIK